MLFKGAFVLGENDFKKSFSPKPRCLVATVNFIFRKMASCWPKFSPLTRKLFYTLIFTSHHFRREREREREPRSESTDRRSTSGAIDEWCDRPTSALDDRTTRRSWSRDDQDRAVFSFFWVCLDLSFPCSSPNTRKYFLEIFLKCNQIHENIFLSRK